MEGGVEEDREMYKFVRDREVTIGLRFRTGAGVSTIFDPIRGGSLRLQAEIPFL